MSNYQIIYYNTKVQSDVLALPDTLLAKYLHLAAVMVEKGANLGMPHTKAMGDGLFELRLKGTEGIARVFYCTIVNRKIVILHSFIKKSDKTPKQELNIAINRKNEVKIK